MSGLIEDVVRNLVPLRPPGGLAAVDARDVGAVIAAAMEPGRGARRYVAAAGGLTLADIIGTARRLTGRRLPGLAAPRPVEESLVDTLRWLCASGRVSRRVAGRLTSEPPATLQEA